MSSSCPLDPRPLPMTSEPLSRDELASRYFDQLPFKLYLLQEEALLPVVC